MIVPFVMPVNGEVFNLAQMVKWKQIREDCCTVTFADGDVHTFTGDPAKIILAGVAFLTNTFREFQVGLDAARRGDSQIVIPTFNGTGK